MKRDFDALILKLDGEPFEDKATLKTVAFLSVTTPLQEDSMLPVEQKMKLYGLAQKVHRGGIVDLSAEDMALLKSRIGSVFNNVVVIGRAFDLLENELNSNEDGESKALS